MKAESENINREVEVVTGLNANFEYDKTKPEGCYICYLGNMRAYLTLTLYMPVPFSKVSWFQAFGIWEVVLVL